MTSAVSLLLTALALLNMVTAGLVPVEFRATAERIANNAIEVANREISAQTVVVETAKSVAPVPVQVEPVAPTPEPIRILGDVDVTYRCDRGGERFFDISFDTTGESDAVLFVNSRKWYTFPAGTSHSYLYSTGGGMQQTYKITAGDDSREGLIVHKDLPVECQ